MPVNFKAGLFAGSFRTLVGVLALFAAIGFCIAILADAPSQRIIAVGDVHGAYDALVGILQKAGVLDTQSQWIGIKTTVVQSGDFLDRGAKGRAVMDFLMTLEKQAPKNEGRVIILLGNHEVMNIVGDLRYVFPEDYAYYAEPDSEKRLSEAYIQYVDFRKRRARVLKHPEPAL